VSLAALDRRMNRLAHSWSYSDSGRYTSQTDIRDILTCLLEKEGPQEVCNIEPSCHGECYFGTGWGLAGHNEFVFLVRGLLSKQMAMLMASHPETHREAVQRCIHNVLTYQPERHPSRIYAPLQDTAHSGVEGSQGR